MWQLKQSALVFSLAISLVGGWGSAGFAQPTTSSYQGRLLISGVPFDGTADFKFAIVSGGVNVWSNDGTPSGEPGQSVELQVTEGVFAVRLGDTSLSGMTVPLTADALQTTSAAIRVWVNTGGGFSQLPDAPLASSPFALQSEGAKQALSGFDLHGDLEIFEDTGERTLYINADDGTTGALMFIYDIDSLGNPRPAIELDSREGSGGGLIRLFNGIEGGLNPNQATVEINAQEGTGPGQITLFDNQGGVAIQLDAEMSDGYSRVITDIVQINGGMDVSENFHIEGEDEEILPGSVVSISTGEAGALTLSTEAYDKKVAGVVSGAGGINVGMLLGQDGSPLSGDHPIALSGRVYCRADATYGAIEPGDLLTTSPTPGHAMKASDPNRVHGTIIGKAMTSLEEGTGLVLVLISLH